jgi:hypothetical protein
LSLKNLFKASIEAAKRYKGLGQTWVFKGNPNCCDKCKKMTGYTVHGPKPKWFPHVPDKDGKFNCKCVWVRVKKQAE